MWRFVRVAARRQLRSIRRQPRQQESLESSGETGQATLELLQFGAFVLFFNNYVVSSTQCIGPSMLPTISTNGDVVLTVPVSWLGRLFGMKPKLGDVVVSLSPNDPNQTVCKRITGMPGDLVSVRPVPGLPHDRVREVTIPEGHCWLAGDNVRDSTDSRFYGAVPLALVQAIVLARVWPISTAGFISAGPPPAVEAPAPAVDVRPPRAPMTVEDMQAASLRAQLDCGPPAKGGASLERELERATRRARAQAEREGRDATDATAELDAGMRSLVSLAAAPPPPLTASSLLLEPPATPADSRGVRKGGWHAGGHQPADQDATDD